ncbi:Rieske 2Fe-2S domain-containing protein [Amycolatopsis sp. GM8]|uniref:Rieske 2Fe-2S domain-containing protein n=1 Tax=Amycolatopsis sp. GM8 TaxID=2896530 RepID=UPI001F1A2DC4|nr:Rieske 2Fe-2S domain-containing protein [Amycolatopsis sp. GM8]
MTATTERVAFSSQVDEWPHSVFPTGWFQLGWLDDLQPGEVKPLRLFSRELVQFRTAGGDVHVLDAHCGHMGANIGHGGWVEGECVVCPFHGWQWGGDGINRYVPAEDRAIDRRRQRSWPVTVTNGIVWIWHDAQGREPQWQPHATQPEFGRDDYYPLKPHCTRHYPDAVARPQYLVENNSDVEHLRWVHGTKSPVRLVDQVEDGPYMETTISLTYGYGKKSTKFTPDGPVETFLLSSTQGVGANMVRYPLDGTITFYCCTPIDDKLAHLYQTLLVRREGGTGDEPSGLAGARVRELIAQFANDFPIWAHQIYITKSPLTRDEAKPMGTLRRWAKQFYA